MTPLGTISTGRIFAAALFGSFIVVLAAPVLWPAMMWMTGEDFLQVASPPQNLLMLLLIVAAFAAPVALAGGVLFGFPTLLLLARTGYNKPWIAAAAGAVFAGLVFLLIWMQRSDWAMDRAWPLLLYIGILGALQGAFSSAFLARPQKVV